MGSPTLLCEGARCFTTVRCPSKLELTRQGVSEDVKVDRDPRFRLFGHELRDQFREDVARRDAHRRVRVHEGARDVAFAIIPRPRISLDVPAKFCVPRGREGTDHVDERGPFCSGIYTEAHRVVEDLRRFSVTPTSQVSEIINSARRRGPHHITTRIICL